MGTAALQIARRQPEFLVEVDKGLAAALLVGLVGQHRQLPRPGRIEVGRADDENRRLLKTRHVGRLQMVQIQIIGVAEGKRHRVLAHLHAVVDAAAHEAGTLERFLAVGDDENRVLVRLQILHQARVAVLAEQAGAQRRRVQVAEVQIHIRARAVGRAGVGGRNQQALHAAFLEHRGPVQRTLDGGEAGRRTRRALDDADLAPDLVGAARNDLVFGNHGDGRAADGVQADGALLVLAAPDHQLGVGALADILGDEFQQRRLGNAGQQDRFGMLEHAHAGDDARRVHADQGHHRLAGISGNIDHVGRQEDIADQTRLAVFDGEGVDIGRRTLALGELLRGRHHIAARRGGAQVFAVQQLGRQLGVVDGGAGGRRAQQRQRRQQKTRQAE